MNSGLYEHVEIFLAIARAGSLTGASIATGIGQATISRQLAALEEHLGCTLFQCSTRAISLTERGAAFLRHAERVVDAMTEAQNAAQEKGGRLRGHIRVASTNGFAKMLLIPILPEWQGLHPEVSIELLLADHLSQIIEERVDVAFRIGALPDSGLIARPIGSFEHIVVTSHTYLQRHARVSLPEHLLRHQCILYTGFEHPELWQFTGPGGEASIRVQSRLQLSSFDSMRDAVEANLGIAAMPEWFWRNALADGSVVRLLPQYRMARRIVHAITAARQAASSKTAHFIRFVEERLPQHLLAASVQDA
jgi:DNA-binding transcriptional LysR family regulator